MLSGGSEPGNAINPVAVAAMAEEGIDISDQVPSILETEQVRESDVVITMGCGDACPIFPGKRYEDWELEDPAGKDDRHRPPHPRRHPRPRRRTASPPSRSEATG